MLSKVEMEYLRFPESFDANYSKVLRHRIRDKVQSLQEELMLLDSAGFLPVMEKYNSVTEFRNGESVLNQAAFDNRVVLRPGFGPGSSARKAGILNRAILPEP